MASSNSPLPGYDVETVGDAKVNFPEPTHHTLDGDPLQDVPKAQPSGSQSQPLSMPTPAPADPLHVGTTTESKLDQEAPKKSPSLKQGAPDANANASLEAEQPPPYTPKKTKGRKGRKGAKKEHVDVEFDVRDDEVITHDPLLSSNPHALAVFLREHGSLKPKMIAEFRGTHTERRTRTVYRNGRTTTEHYTVTVVDFEFNIDLEPYMLPEPTFWSIADTEPAYRGTVGYATEPNGPVNVERRQLQTSDVQDDEEAWEVRRTRLGLPPWTPNPSTLGGEPSSATERAVGLQDQPLASSRTLEEWCEDYCSSKRIIKDFKFSKFIYGWNTEQLESSLERIIRGTGYNTTITINFTTTSRCIHVWSNNLISRYFASHWAMFLLFFLFPFFWLWKRYWPGASGKWEVVGTAWAMNRWDLAEGTSEGESVEQARSRLSVDDYPWLEDPEKVQERMKLGPGGVWIWRGTREGEWFRKWEKSIRMGVVDRVRTDWLTRLTDEGQQGIVERAGQVLDGF